MRQLIFYLHFRVYYLAEMAPTAKKSGGAKIKYEMALGLTKGHQVTKVKPPVRPVSRKGRLTRHNKLVRDVIREVSGVTPYEKRTMELLRISRDKRALKFLKRRLGTAKRGKRKREEMQSMIQQMRKAAAHHEHKEHAEKK